VEFVSARHTHHSSNKKIIENQQLHTDAGIKAIEVLRHSMLRPYRILHGELSHRYGNENFKFILFSQWENVSLIALRLYEVCRNLLAESKTEMILYMFQG